ncbi:MAG: hypothetical protein ACO3GE_08645 [Steroidobacteraceae bacterium]|jgi:hypothetical protein
MKISGVKSYLRRTKTNDELEALADTVFASATEEVVITSIGSEGASSSGQVSFPKWLLLQAIEEILIDGGRDRQLAVTIDRSRFNSPL